MNKSVPCSMRKTNINCRIRKRLKNPDESIRYILKPCKNGLSEPEENKSGGVFQNKKRNSKNNKNRNIDEIEIDEATSYKYSRVIIRNMRTFREHVSVIKIRQ